VQAGDDTATQMLDQLRVHWEERTRCDRDVPEPQPGKLGHHHVEHVVAVAQVMMERDRRAVLEAARLNHGREAGRSLLWCGTALRSTADARLTRPRLANAPVKGLIAR